MMDYAAAFLHDVWIILNEASPYVLLGFFVAALLKAFISDAFVARHLGSRTKASVLKASIIGVPLPLCSCGVIPAASGLRRQGASKGATTSFMISTPETGVDSMAVTWALLDPVMTVLRPIAAFVTAAVAGFAVNALPEDTPQKPAAQDFAMATGCGCGCEDDNCTDAQQPSLKERLREGFNHAFGEMLADIGKWLLIGIGIAGAISAFVPEAFLEEYLGNELLSLLVMLVAGVPLYVCATASTPIAASLALKGLSPGAALVFLLASPATNAATITVATRILGKRATAVYVAAIALVSVVVGWLVNRVYFALGLDITAWVNAAEADSVTVFSMVSSVALLLLVLRSMVRQSSGGCGCGDCSSSNGSVTGQIDGSRFVVK